MSCDELSQESASQLLFTKASVASAMLDAFYAWRQGKLRHGALYLDILEGEAYPAARPSKSLLTPRIASGPGSDHRTSCLPPIVFNPLRPCAVNPEDGSELAERALA